MNAKPRNDHPRQTTNASSPGKRPHAFFLALALSILVALGQAAQAGEHVEETLEFTMSPESGTPGTYVWLNGTGFTSDTRVYFGGLALTHDRYSEESLGFTVPNQPPSTYKVEVETETERGSVCCFLIPEVNQATNDSEPKAEDTATDAGDQKLGSTDADCRESGINLQCNAFGTIKMPSQKNIKGEAVDIKTEITLDTNLQDRDARFVLFSVRNVTEDGENPVVIKVNGFSTPAGEIITTRVDESPNEVNLWVHVLDVPVGVPLTIDLTVGSTDRGAYLLETLVMPFDRGYAPIFDANGQEFSLYSYTLLGVNQETSANIADGGSGAMSRVPAPGVVPLLVLGAIGAVAAARSRGRSS